VVIGVGMLLKPELAVRGWIGARAASFSGTQAVTQGFGARDLVLGAGTLAAMARGSDAREWVAAGGAADVADLAATVLADDIPTSGRVLVGAMAGSAIAITAGYLIAGGE
jgi:hypothetical protein